MANLMRLSSLTKQELPLGLGQRLYPCTPQFRTIADHQLQMGG